jgi:hypothetical protein
MNGLPVGSTCGILKRERADGWGESIGANFTNFYWTVRLTIVDWVIVPEVALMVTADVPAGVDGTKTLL